MEFNMVQKTTAVVHLTRLTDEVLSPRKKKSKVITYYGSTKDTGGYSSAMALAIDR